MSNGRVPSERQIEWGSRYMVGFLFERGVSEDELFRAGNGYVPDPPVLAEMCKEAGAWGKDFVDVFYVVRGLGAKAYMEYV